jgi:hypothetical protein
MRAEHEVREVKRRHAAQLLGLPGVSGVGVEKDDSGQFVLTLHLVTSDPKALSALPSEIEGVPVRFVASGPFRKFPG